MKQAILIVAYRDIDYLIRVINQFNDVDYLFFIHLNKKSILPESDLLRLKSINNVKLVEQRFSTQWGSVNHLRAILYLCEEALKYSVEYIHLISGQDYPIKSGVQISEFLSRNKGNEYLEYHKVPYQAWEDEDYGYDRIKYYHFNDYFNSNTKLGRGILKMSLKMQAIVGISRPWHKSLPSLYGGGTWWTLTSPAIKYVLDYSEGQPSVLKRFEHTKIAEEMFFQTILLQSPFKDNIINNNLRYILWEEKYGSRPAILDENNFDELINTEALFARKFVQPISSKLIQKLDSLTSEI